MYGIEFEYGNMSTPVLVAMALVEYAKLGKLDSGEIDSAKEKMYRQKHGGAVMEIDRVLRARGLGSR